MRPLPRQPARRLVPCVPLRKLGRTLPLPDGGHRARGGVERRRLSRPLLCFRFFMLRGSSPSILILSFLVLGALGGWEGKVCLQGSWQIPRAGEGDFRVPSEVTRQSRPRTGGTAGAFRCQPGPDPVCGTDASGELQRQLLRAWRPAGRALGSEPPALAWSPPLYLVRITSPTPHPGTIPSSGGEEEGLALADSRG